MNIRAYTTADYEQVVVLYKREDLYGGQFDADRDSAARLEAAIKEDPNSVLVAEEDGKIVGTVSLLQNARQAWLFRFAAEEGAVNGLYERAAEVLKARGHKQVLVYSAAGDKVLDERYLKLGFTKGNNFTAFWKEF